MHAYADVIAATLAPDMAEGTQKGSMASLSICSSQRPIHSHLQRQTFFNVMGQSFCLFSLTFSPGDGANTC